MISPKAEPPKAELPKAATCSRYAHSTKKLIFSTLRLVCSPVWGIFRRFGSFKSPEDFFFSHANLLEIPHTGEHTSLRVEKSYETLRKVKKSLEKLGQLKKSSEKLRKVRKC